MDLAIKSLRKTWREAFAQYAEYARRGGQDQALESAVLQALIHFVDDGAEEFFFRFTGEAKIKDGWSAGYILEIGLWGANSSQFSQDSVGSSNNNQLTTRKSAWFIKSKELGKVTKKWSGLGKELLTSADNYVLEISPSLAANDPARPLILAAVLCIDLVLKE